MNLNAKDYLNKPYARILVPNEDNTFSAEILEFPGCFAHGKTPNEAFQNLESAAISWIEAALEQRQEIPVPSATYGYTGKIALRLPKSIHKKAIQLAQRDGTSLNQFLLSAIAARVGAEDLYSHLTDKLENRFSVSNFCSIGLAEMKGVTVGGSNFYVNATESVWSGTPLLCFSVSPLRNLVPMPTGQEESKNA